MWAIADTKKQIDALPVQVKVIAYALLDDLMESGPKQPSWPHFGPLGKEKKLYQQMHIIVT